MVSSEVTTVTLIILAWECSHGHLRAARSRKASHAGTFHPSACVTFAKIHWPNQLTWLRVRVGEPYKVFGEGRGYMEGWRIASFFCELPQRSRKFSAKPEKEPCMFWGSYLKPFTLFLKSNIFFALLSSFKYNILPRTSRLWESHLLKTEHMISGVINVFIL